jgi:hypothetical protein
MGQNIQAECDLAVALQLCRWDIYWHKPCETRYTPRAEDSGAQREEGRGRNKHTHTHTERERERGKGWNQRTTMMLLLLDAIRLSIEESGHVRRWAPSWKSRGMAVKTTSTSTTRSSTRGSASLSCFGEDTRRASCVMWACLSCTEACATTAACFCSTGASCLSALSWPLQMMGTTGAHFPLWAVPASQLSLALRYS